MLDKFLDQGHQWLEAHSHITPLHAAVGASNRAGLEIILEHIDENYYDYR